MTAYAIKKYSTLVISDPCLVRSSNIPFSYGFEYGSRSNGPFISSKSIVRNVFASNLGSRESNSSCTGHLLYHIKRSRTLVCSFLFIICRIQHIIRTVLNTFLCDITHDSLASGTFFVRPNKDHNAPPAFLYLHHLL